MNACLRNFAILSMSVALMLIVLCANQCRADGAGDNVAAKVRPIPAKGIDVLAADRKALETELTALSGLLKQLDGSNDLRIRSLVPDVRIFYKAVHDALTYNEFLKTDDIARAKSLLKEGRERAEQLLAGGVAPWDTATGLVVRGYVSRIDGSTQPYGLIVPDSYKAVSDHRHPMNVWFHGRNEELTEINFLTDREHNRGDFTPTDTIVLHPYERYCNAGKFAGEVDVLEAMESVKGHYRVDEDRIAERGFSMGGAAAWHFAVHYPSLWAAANPGAGFAETPEFLRVFQNEKIDPPEYERKLLHLYDCTDWAANLFNCPTVAYSGELDTQRQAAEIMTKAMEGEGLKLTHIIGPGAHHNFEPEAKKKVASLVDELVAKGRPSDPPKIRFTTYTLKYNRQYWITVDALDEHWKRAYIEADLGRDQNGLNVKTENIAEFTVMLDGASIRLAANDSSTIPLTCNGSSTLISASRSRAGFYHWHFKRSVDGKGFEIGNFEDGLHKRHNLQGPIDDAFMDSFIFVAPSGHAKQPAVEKWVSSEFSRAKTEWRRQFRGEARVKDDTAITDDDIVNFNLVLWGTPDSNAVLKRIADKLPIRWERDKIVVGGKGFPADRHAVILIYPNPLNPQKYVVLNSGFTYREYDYLNNARQVPKLPDWAIVDLSVPPDARAPGKIAAADFFNEQWQLKK